MLRAGVSVMKIARHEFAIADDQIARKDIKILRAGIEMRGITRAGFEFAQQYGVSAVPLPPGLKDKVLRRIEETEAAKSAPLLPPLGLSFARAASESGWKQLPIPGASIKLLSLERDRGYAVLLGKLEAGARYPAHFHNAPEDFYILTGDLVVGDRKLVAGDFHHADAGSRHEENHSIEGCTLLAVLTASDPLVAFAIS